ncbi:hypothetical protein FAGKG844_40170 [Frankia sp. AgKG'84/4]
MGHADQCGCVIEWSQHLADGNLGASPPRHQLRVWAPARRGSGPCVERCRRRPRGRSRPRAGPARPRSGQGSTATFPRDERT